MCVSKGAPKKPSYGPCNESHQNPITYAYPQYVPTGGWYTGSTTAGTAWYYTTGTASSTAGTINWV